ncbi:hypothetical protein AMTRI_Chr06g171960 [Amborella trichopoda]
MHKDNYILKQIIGQVSFGGLFIENIKPPQCKINKLKGERKMQGLDQTPNSKENRFQKGRSSRVIIFKSQQLLIKKSPFLTITSNFKIIQYSDHADKCYFMG